MEFNLNDIIEVDFIGYNNAQHDFIKGKIVIFITNKARMIITTCIGIPLLFLLRKVNVNVCSHKAITYSKIFIKWSDCLEQL